MLTKLMAGGQTGADRAALDVAIKFDIPYGGWIPKGRLAEDGALPDKYRLKELPTDRYSAATEQNVIDSDGTLIFSRGKPAGATDDAREMALKHRKQLLGIDLNLTPSFDAASLIVSWIQLRRIKTLNVTGPRASTDPQIYTDVFRILEMAVQRLKRTQRGPAGTFKPVSRSRPLPPPTVAKALERLLSGLTLKDKTTIANMAEVELSTLHPHLGEYIQNEFGLLSGNTDLLRSCSFLARRGRVAGDEAAAIIIRELWKRLRETHKLRVVK
ncbi:MAG: putative molybdenum carrier protein [Desulfobacterales bacterium]|nr:MAG: putative molybdenum carrier protein [Desulfobacterales bacterium]